MTYTFAEVLWFQHSAAWRAAVFRCLSDWGRCTGTPSSTMYQRPATWNTCDTSAVEKTPTSTVTHCSYMYTEHQSLYH